MEAYAEGVSAAKRGRAALIVTGVGTIRQVGGRLHLE